MNAIHTWQNPLDSRQLNAFVTLARTGSFTEAGRELFLTHSAICHSVRALEDELGCRLLNRLGKTIELTAAGESFLHDAQTGLKNFAEARLSFHEFKALGSQRLKIGA
jgi:DNA-binding transcriptional LysR family regulator